MKKRILEWPLRIAIFGQKEHGKSTFANLLEKELNRKIVLPNSLENLPLNFEQTFTRTAFAHPIKKMLNLVYGLTEEDINDLKKSGVKPEGWNVTVRQAMQLIGTECFRAIDPQTWCKLLNKSTGNVIVDDGRFSNELEYCRDNGWLNILMYRPDKVDWKPEHDSEVDAVKWYHQYMHGDLDELYNAGFTYMITNTSIEHLTQIAEQIATAIYHNMRNAGAVK